MISQHFIQVKYDNYSIYIHFHKLCFCSSNYDIPSGNSSIVYQLHSYVSLPIGNFPLVIFHSCSHQKQRHLHLHFHREFIPSSASGRWGRRSAMRSYSAEVGRGLDDNLGETVLNGVLSWIYIYIYLKNHSLCLFPYLGVSSWKSKIRWYIPKSSRNWALVEIWQFDKKSQALPNQHGSSVAHPVAVGGQATFLGYLYGPLCLPVRPECGVPGECVVCAGILFHQVLVLGAKLLPRPASRQLGWDSPSDLWGKWFVF